jgi:hypothetical protein
MAKTKWEKGWKVIKRKTRTSAVVPEGNAYVVNYFENKIVRKPNKCGPLAVFKTRRHARDFVKLGNWQERKVVRCLYRPSKYNMLWTPNTQSGRLKSFGMDLPRGTAFADEVKCLE